MTATKDMLQNRDFTFIVDKSGSMERADGEAKTRWERARETTFAMAAKCQKYDPDGLTLYTFASDFKRYEGVTADRVDTVWNENEPGGSTALHLVLKDALDSFHKRKKAGQLKENGELIIVITDGEPDDQQAVAKVIVEATKGMDKDEELAILFAQIGNDAGATKFLEFLDDGLEAKGAKFDIVDTRKFSDIEGKPMDQVLLDAIND